MANEPDNSRLNSRTITFAECSMLEEAMNLTPLITNESNIIEYINNETA